MGVPVVRRKRFWVYQVEQYPEDCISYKQRGVWKAARQEGVVCHSQSIHTGCPPLIKFGRNTPDVCEISVRYDWLVYIV